MPFDLPRSPRSLRFTGEVRAVTKEEEAKDKAGALGQARPGAQSMSAPPPSARAAPMVTPPASRLTTPTRLTTMRGPVPSIGDEEVDTLCLDRDALDIALLPDARHAKNLPVDIKAGPNLPVPHFRSKDEVAQHRREPVIVRTPKRGSLPLGIWLFAAMLAGIASFHFAPQARESLQEAVRALDSR
jgi:hypothetical protein